MMLRVENLELLYSKIYTVETGFAAEVSIYPSLGMSFLLNYNISKGIESHCQFFYEHPATANRILCISILCNNI